MKKLYQLYLEDNESASQTLASENFYRKVFTEEFNLGFHVPSKYQCDLCDVCQKRAEPTEEECQEYDAYIRRKEEARDKKNRDKVLDDGTLVICFDLQPVITIPGLFAGSA